VSEVGQKELENQEKIRDIHDKIKKFNKEKLEHIRDRNFVTINFIL
jgi:hypothetical protein